MMTRQVNRLGPTDLSFWWAHVFRAGVSLMHFPQEHCVIVTNNGSGGALPKVEDRGSDLNGSFYAALGSSREAPSDSEDARGKHRHLPN